MSVASCILLGGGAEGGVARDEPPGERTDAYQWWVAQKIILALALRPEITQKNAAEKKDERAYSKSFRDEEMKKWMH